MRKILSLDISSVATGYCVMGEDSQIIESGTFKMKSKDSHGKRLGLLEAKINELIEKYQPTVLGIEDIFLRNVKTFKVLSYYRGLAELIWFKYKAEPTITFTPSELRKMIQRATGVKLTGKRKKNKELVFNYIKSKYSFSDFEFKVENDRTDAIAVALAVEIDLFAKEAKALKIGKPNVKKSVRNTGNTSGVKSRRSKKSI